MNSRYNKKPTQTYLNALTINQELISEERKNSSLTLFTFTNQIEMPEPSNNSLKPLPQVMETQSTSVDDDLNIYSNYKMPKRRDATTRLLNFESN